VHVRIERGTNGVDDPRAGPFVHLRERAADGTEPRQIEDEIFLRHRASDVQRPQLDGGPAALFENLPNTRLACQRELAGFVRLARGKIRQHRRRNALRRRHERILRHAPPGNAPQLAVIRRRAPEVRERGDKVVEEHDAEARHDRVETRGLEPVILRTRANEIDANVGPLGARPSSSDHRLGDIDAGAATLCSEPPRGGDGRHTGAAADVEYPAGRTGTDLRDDQLCDRLERAVEQLLGLDPRLRGKAVPELLLLGAGTPGLHLESMPEPASARRSRASLARRR
jgi:hypothetical protein